MNAEDTSARTRVRRRATEGPVHARVHYEGHTLHEHLGVPIVGGRHADGAAVASSALEDTVGNPHPPVHLLAQRWVATHMVPCYAVLCCALL